MKILKPGKVEQRKFVCPSCECEFICAEIEDAVTWDEDDCHVRCPICRENLLWCDGEPYEEPTLDVIERLADLIYESCNTDAETAWEIAKHQFEHGVTFREG